MELEKNPVTRYLHRRNITFLYLLKGGMQCLHFLSCSVIIRGSAPIIIFKYKKYTIFTIISVVTYSDKMFHCELLETFLRF